MDTHVHRKELRYIDVIPTRRLVSGVFIHLVPGSVLLLPDYDFTVVGTGSQDVAKHRMSPRHLPHGTLMSAQTRRHKFKFQNPQCETNDVIQ